MPKKNIKLKMLRTVSYICFLCVFQISSCFDYNGNGNKSSSKSLTGNNTLLITIILIFSLTFSKIKWAYFK